MSKYTSILTSFPLFRGITSDEIEAMIRCSGSLFRSYKKDEIIFLEHDLLNWAGVVVTGEVYLSQENLQGSRSLILKLKPGELFGESYACGSIKESRMVVVTATDSVVLLMPYAVIQTQCTNACPFHHRLIENTGIMLADKNIRLMERMMALSQKTLREKILIYLDFERDMAQRHPLAAAGKAQPSDAYDGWFPISHNRTQLAEHLCADRTAVSRELSSMKADKVIDFENNLFKLL